MAHMERRRPYVGHGADGARRSGWIDRSEADTEADSARRDELLLSAERWFMQAEAIDTEGDR